LGCEEAAILRELAMSTLTYIEGRPYYSSLTKRYYPTFDAAFLDSLREGGGSVCDFNLYFVHPNGDAEFVY
jgi:hypothetical protein